jgi:hypothetical protein
MNNALDPTNWKIFNQMNKWGFGGKIMVKTLIPMELQVVLGAL